MFLATTILILKNTQNEDFLALTTRRGLLMNLIN